MSEPFLTALLLRSQFPELRSDGLAMQLNAQLAPESRWSDVSTRKLLQRARERFAHALLDEVACSLGQPTREELEAELAELSLLDHCQKALESWKLSTTGG